MPERDHYSCFKRNTKRKKDTGDLMGCGYSNWLAVRVRGAPGPRLGFGGHGRDDTRLLVETSLRHFAASLHSLHVSGGLPRKTMVMVDASPPSV